MDFSSGLPGKNPFNDNLLIKWFNSTALIFINKKKYAWRFP